MNATANLPFQPQIDNAGMVRGFALAALVHALLFTFLYFGISWQIKTPEVLEGTMWTPLPPMTAAPAPKVVPVEPPPPPKVEEPAPVEPPPPAPPDIKIQEPVKKPVAKKIEPPKPVEPPKKIEPKVESKKIEPKVEPRKVEPRPAPRDNIAAEAAKEAEKFSRTSLADAVGKEQENLRAGAAGRAARTWIERVASLVRSKVPVNVAEAVPGNPTAKFEVTLLPGREVGLVKLIQSSGNPAYDEAAERAIKAISPLPPFTEGMEPQRLLKLDTRPKDQ